MTKTRHLFVGLTVALASWLAAGSTVAHAQTTTHSWVASNGNDSSNCDRPTPCATFTGAFAKTITGGEITCADSGNFVAGSVTINRSMTINCEGVIGTNGYFSQSVGAILVTTSGDDRVILRGLDIDLLTVFFGNGLRFNGSGTLVLDRMKISNVHADKSLSGISFTPNGPSQLIVTDSIIVNNGLDPGGAGILVKPQSGGTARVSLERVNASGNAFGIAADGTGSTGGINMTIADSMVSGNSQDGIIAVTPSGGAPIGVMVTNTKSVNNTFGIRSIGPNVTVRVKNSDIMGNNTGLSFSGGGAILTYGNNAVNTNGADGAFSGPVPLQ
jgi:hypothetical protein